MVELTYGSCLGSQLREKGGEDCVRVAPFAVASVHRVRLVGLRALIRFVCVCACACACVSPCVASCRALQVEEDHRRGVLLVQGIDSTIKGLAANPVKSQFAVASAAGTLQMWSVEHRSLQMVASFKDEKVEPSCLVRYDLLLLPACWVHIWCCFVSSRLRVHSHRLLPSCRCVCLVQGRESGALVFGAR
jgi:hypothetical protein